MLLTQEERDLVTMLRQEANNVKDCFTKYSFQALATAGAGLGLILKLQRDEPLLGLAGILVIVLVLAVERMGVTKYATANRHFGYELHLYRTARLAETPTWKPAMREIGWEEAMRAWRVVQTTTFANLFSRGMFRRNILKRKHRSGIDYKWFEVTSLVEASGATWHAGMYWKTMLGILHFVALAALLPIAAMCLQLQARFGLTWPFWAAVATLGAAAGVVILRLGQVDARRRLLESGFLSIHSCAVMWHATVAAHHRVLEELLLEGNGRLTSYESYTERLGRLAVDLNQDIGEIQRWIMGTSRKEQRPSIPGRPRESAT